MITNEETIENNKKSAVTDSEWLICDSKSRPGVKYYFNPFNGTAVWNLTDSEQIQKACNQTKKLEKQLGTAIVNHIEPKEQPPMDQPWNIPSTVYNQQVINTQFPNQQHTTTTFNVVSTTQYGNVWGNPTQAPQYVIVPSGTPGASNLQAPGTPAVTNLQAPGTPVVTNLQAPGTPAVTNLQAPGTPVVTNLQAPGIPAVTNLQAPGTPAVTNLQAPGTPVVTNLQAPGIPVVTNLQAPGTPHVTNLQAPGTPLVTNLQAPGTPLVTNLQAPGTPHVTNLQAPGTPHVTNLQAPGTPHVTNLQAPGTPLVTNLQAPITNSNELQRNFVQPNPEDDYQNSYQHNRFYHKGRNNFYTRYKNKHFGRQHSNIVNKNRGKDLRQKLTTKRNKCECANHDPKPETYSNNHFDDQLDNYYKQDNENMEILDATTLDMTPLKQMVLSKFPQTEQWFIVVDIDIIMNHNRFFNNLIGADQNCFIVVPHHVIEELETLATEKAFHNACRIWRFLTQQIESDLVSKGTEINNSVISAALKTFKTCLNVASENNCVILLSNNPETQIFKSNNSRISVMTSSEFQKILVNVSVKPVRARSPTLNIKIIVPNTLHTNETATTTEEIFSSTSRDASEDDETKLTLETSAQDTENKTESQELITCQDEESFQTEKITVDVTKTDKKVRLVRSLSNQKTNINENTEKQQFRWRKRRSGQRNVSETSLVNEDNIERSEVERNTSPYSFKKSIPSIVCSETSKSKKSSIGTFHETECYKRSNEYQYDKPGSSSVQNVPNTPNTMVKAKAKIHHNPMKSATMFEIENESMEDILRTRCDEWVSRFVQIMEEILHIKLQEDPPFVNNELPPPWSLHEAAKCIIKKYVEFFNVVDAANNLSYTLHKINDKGNISMNMEPSEYLEMYSYGVYLVDSLMNINSNCEEVCLASESLKKLLHDIKNANLDLCHNDTFVDEHHESSTKDTSNKIDEISFSSDITLTKTPKTRKSTKKNVINSSPQSKATYNLRSNKKNNSQQKEKPIEDPGVSDEAFFDCLKLQRSPNAYMGRSADKSITGTTNITDKSPTNISGIYSFTTPKSSVTDGFTAPKTSAKADEIAHTSSVSEKSNKTPADVDHSDQDDEHVSTIKPKIIRNFIKFAEFEERLSKTTSSYSISSVDNEDGQDYNNDEDNYSDEYYDEEDNEHEHEKEPMNEIIEENENTSIEIESNTTKIENTKKFMRNFIQDVKQTLEKVRLFCTKNFKKQTTVKCVVLKKKAEDMSLFLAQIVQQLESIITREQNESDNLQVLLKNNNNLTSDNDLYLSYIKMVVLYKDQARILLNVLKLF